MATVPILYALERVVFSVVPCQITIVRKTLVASGMLKLPHPKNHKKYPAVWLQLNAFPPACHKSSKCAKLILRTHCCSSLQSYTSIVTCFVCTVAGEAYNAQSPGMNCLDLMSFDIFKQYHMTGQRKCFVKWFFRPHVNCKYLRSCFDYLLSHMQMPVPILMRDVFCVPLVT